VNSFFENPTLGYQQQLKKACADAGVRSTIIMCDNEGAAAALDKAERIKAAIAHRKWIDIAHELGCISVRCNVRGGANDWRQDPDLTVRAAEAFRHMLDYAQGSQLDILVENHGGASSDPDLLVDLVKKVDHPKFGLLCDLGNWNRGTDRYAAVRKILPYSKGLSVKGTWGAALDPAFDCEKLVRTAFEGGYRGYWGLEVTPRPSGVSRTPAEQFDTEVRTVLEAKAITERVVFAKS
jgi:sugar phosphate isomerase/epimerase